MSAKIRGGEPKTILSLLQKYKELKTPNESVIRTFCAMVNNDLGIPLKRTDISYNISTRTLRVNVQGPKKSEVLLSKDRLLKKCREELGENNTPQNVI